MGRHKILAVKTTDGLISPLAWTKRDLSRKEVRRLTKQFRTDQDYADGVLISADRIYRDFREYIGFPEIK